MKIEVTVGNEDPVIYVMSSDQVILGKEPDCDVVVVDPKVSRKHLKIEFVKGRYFLTDLGSTNGTYINEERILQGEKVEFFSFFPARLGTNVLLSVVQESNEENQNNLEKAEKTQVVTLRDLNSANTSRLIQKKKKLQNKIRAKEQEQFKLKLLRSCRRYFSIKMIVAYFILGLGIFFTFNKQSDSELKKDKVFTKVVKKNTETKAEKAPEIPFEMLDKHFEEEKCSSELEMLICRSLVSDPKKPWGVKIKDRVIYIQVPASEFYKQALKMVHQNDDMSKGSLWSLVAAIFLSQGIKPDLDYRKIKDYSFIFALYEKPAKVGLAAVIQMKTESLENVKVLLDKKRMEAITLHGVDVIDFTKDYYSVLPVIK